MRRKYSWVMLVLLLITSACIFSVWKLGTRKPAGAIPAPMAEKYNVVVVMGSTEDTDTTEITETRWDRWQREGLQAAAARHADVNLVVLGNRPEYEDQGRLFTALGEAKYRLVIGAEYGYMESMQAAAKDFPDTIFINVLGQKNNDKNLGSLYGAMEEMTYLAGMLAGLRAAADEQDLIGYIATQVTPEQFRQINAAALGMHKTCEKCRLDIRWLGSWQDAGLECRAAQELFNEGAQVVINGAGGFDICDEEGKKSWEEKWFIPVGSMEDCRDQPRCLTAAYWNWEQVYDQILSQAIKGEYKSGSQYFQAASGGLGIYGLMKNQTPTPGMKELDEADLKEVQDRLAEMLAGDFTRVNIFTGPIKDQRGNIILGTEGEGDNVKGIAPKDSDLDQFPPGGKGEECKMLKTCIYWWAEGIIADLPAIRN